MQEHGLDTPKFNDFKCEICGEYRGFNWSDQHGQGMCNVCGTPYDLLGLSPDISIKDVALYKQYWEETHEYIGAGTIMSFTTYPECKVGQEKFYAWIEEHDESSTP